MDSDLFDLNYPDVVARCQSSEEFCNNEFWWKYLEQHYGIEEYRNSRNVSILPREIASLAHQLLNYIFDRKVYPAREFRPLVFLVYL